MIIVSSISGEPILQLDFPGTVILSPLEARQLLSQINESAFKGVTVVTLPNGMRYSGHGFFTSKVIEQQQSLQIEPQPTLRDEDFGPESNVVPLFG